MPIIRTPPRPWSRIAPSFIPIIPKNRAIFAEMTKVGPHLTKTQVPATNPIIHDPRNGVEPGRMAAFYPRLKPAQDEEVAMYQFVQESGEQESAVVCGVLENGL